MWLALDARQHTLHVVQTADQTGPQSEAGRTELGSDDVGAIKFGQPGSKRGVHDDLQWLAPLLGHLRQSGGDVPVESHRGAHSLML